MGTFRIQAASLYENSSTSIRRTTARKSCGTAARPAGISPSVMFSGRGGLAAEAASIAQQCDGLKFGAPIFPGMRLRRAGADLPLRGLRMALTSVHSHNQSGSYAHPPRAACKRMKSSSLRRSDYCKFSAALKRGRNSLAAWHRYSCYAPRMDGLFKKILNGARTSRSPCLKALDQMIIRRSERARRPARGAGSARLDG